MSEESTDRLAENLMEAFVDAYMKRHDLTNREEAKQRLLDEWLHNHD